MTRTQLFVTLSMVICATAPCADGMAAPPPSRPILPDALWSGLQDLHAVVSASMNGSTTHAAGWMMAALLAWRSRSLALTLLACGSSRRRSRVSLRTIVGGLPASGVAGGVPLLTQPPSPTTRPSPATASRLGRFPL